MIPIEDERTNDHAKGPKGFEFVATLPIEKEDIVLGKVYTRAHTIRYQLEDWEIEQIKNGHKEIVVTCIGFMPIIGVGLAKLDLESFKELYMDRRKNLNP